MPSTTNATLCLGKPCACGQESSRREIVQPMVGEHVAHALARALAPQRHADALAGGLQLLHMLGQRFEHIGARLGALGGKIAASPRADIDDVARLRHRETAKASPAAPP